MTQRADMFVDPESDPRHEPPTEGNERVLLTAFLDWQRDTLRLKCAGLDPVELARRAVDPSTLSLLGLVRHLSDVERGWFRRIMAGEDAPDRFSSKAEPDGAFDGAAPEQALVDEAWAAWEEEVTFANRFVAAAADLDITGRLPDP